MEGNANKEEKGSNKMPTYEVTFEKALYECDEGTVEKA